MLRTSNDFALRRASLALAWSVLLTIALSVPAHAVLRSPQVAISGNTLASFFAARGQAIDPATDQIVLSSFALLNVGIPSGLSIITRCELGGGSLDLLNASWASPPLYLIFPGAAASPGWFTISSARENPTRLIVSTFDPQSSFVGTTTYLAGPPDLFNLAFAFQGPSGTKYSQDERNPGGLPRILGYAGTGANHGSLWLCVEDQPAGTGDFADAVYLIEGLSAVPVQRTTWGTLKERFR